MFCPECKVEYRPGFTRCSDCDVGLVEVLPEEASSDELVKMKEGGSKFTVYLALMACLLGIVGSMLWWQRETRQARQKEELRSLYGFACGGDRTSFTRLRDLKPSDSTPQLEHMATAREQDCFADMRVAAIEALSSRGLPNEDALTGLLGIDHPFVVRHAIAEAFIQHGCDGLCVASALDSLRALSRGQPALETNAETEIETLLVDPRDIEKSRQHLKELQQQAQNDYFRLLSTNPCEVQKNLQSKYSSDHEFIDAIQKNVPSC